MSGPVVETAYGKVAGATSGEVHEFRGIPYGASTEGRGRFGPPAAPKPWAAVRTTTSFGPTAPQPSGGATQIVPAEFLQAIGGGTGQPPVGEDCLVLNVWTPALGEGRRPVMVWLHGGGHAMGSGSTYDGSRLAARGDVVVVTINHRLGMMGYLYLDELAPAQFSGSGMAGMLDVVAALEWVRDNIGAFGGDPANVTVFGESGGGSKVSTLMAMPSAHGLIHKAIVQSGPGLRGVEASAASEGAERVLAELGITAADAHELVELPLDRLLETQRSVTRPGTQAGGARMLAGVQFAPVVDGTALPQHPFDPAASPLASEIPLIVGTNKDESATFLLGHPRFGAFTRDDVEELAASTFGDRAQALLDVYARVRPDATPSELYIAMRMTDSMWLDSIRLAERKGAGGPAPVFMYHFEYETDVLGGKLKSAHGLEIPFVFDEAETAKLTGTRPERIPLAHAMSAAWVAFAASGDPNHAALPKWTPYTPGDRATMVFDVACRVDVDPRTELREGLTALGVGRAF